LFATFPHTVPDEDQDKGLLDELEGEVDAILNWMLEGLDRLLERGRFTNERSREEKETIMTEYGGVVDRFVSNVLEVTGDSEDRVHKGDLYDVFTRYNDFIGREPAVQQVLTRELKSIDGVSDGQSRRVAAGDARERVYTGIRVDEDALIELQADEPRHLYSDDDRATDPSSRQGSLT
jgi:phage/plasmid-associated DNA primase